MVFVMSGALKTMVLTNAPGNTNAVKMPRNTTWRLLNCSLTQSSRVNLGQERDCLNPILKNSCLIRHYPDNRDLDRRR